MTLIPPGGRLATVASGGPRHRVIPQRCSARTAGLGWLSICARRTSNGARGSGPLLSHLDCPMRPLQMICSHIVTQRRRRSPSSNNDRLPNSTRRELRSLPSSHRSHTGFTPTLTPSSSTTLTQSICTPDTQVCDLCAHLKIESPRQGLNRAGSTLD